MTQLSLPDTTALTERGAAVRDLLMRAGAVVEVDAQASALIASGMRVQQLLDRVADDLDIGSTLTVDSDETLDEAQAIAGRLATVGSDSGEIERERKMLTAPLNAVVKLLNAGYNAPREHIAGVLDPLKRRILGYHQMQRIKAEEAARAEREKRERDAREASEREAAARKEADELLAAAKQAQAAGSDITAHALAQEAGTKMDTARTEAHAAVTAMHTTVKAAPIAKAKGVRGKWTAEQTNLENLIVHVADRIKAGDHSLTGLLVLDQSTANKKASVEEAGFNVPGLRANFSESVSVRRAAL